MIKEIPTDAPFLVFWDGKGKVSIDIAGRYPAALNLSLEEQNDPSIDIALLRTLAVIRSNSAWIVEQLHPQTKQSVPHVSAPTPSISLSPLDGHVRRPTLIARAGFTKGSLP